MSTKPLMPIAGRIKFTEGEPYEDGSLGKKIKDLDDSVANETSDRQYADAVIQNQLNEETLHLVPNYISNANTFFTAGAGKTNTATTGLPPEVSAYEHDKWGTIFYLPENEEEHTGTQIYHCIAYNGSPNRGKIYKRLIISGVPTAWEVVGGTTDAEGISYDNTESGLSAENVQDAIDELAEEKQDNLVSGTNIKTVNGQSILGSGNIETKGHINAEYILLSSNWESTDTEYTQSVQSNDFFADADYDVCPPPTFINKYGYYGIIAKEQSDGAIIFHAKSQPEEDIYVYITRRM